MTANTIPSIFNRIYKKKSLISLIPEITTKPTITTSEQYLEPIKDVDTIFENLPEQEMNTDNKTLTVT